MNKFFIKILGIFISLIKWGKEIRSKLLNITNIKVIFYKIILPFIVYKPWRKKIKSQINNNKLINLIKSVFPNVKCQIFQIIECNMGEAVIYALTSVYWYKGGYVIGTKNYHKQIFKMICPDIPFLLFPKNEKKGNLVELKTKKWDISYVLSNQELGQMNLTRSSFFLNWQKYLGQDFSNLSYLSPVISKETEDSAIRKLEKMGLSLDNLFFLSDEALSLNPLSKEFWESIKQTIKNKNMRFFINKSKGSEDEVLTIDEAYFVASKCKMIIALRSGLIDLLCLCKVPLRIIYGVNDFYKDIQDMYTLSVYPFCNKNLVEYNINHDTLENIQSKLIYEIEQVK